MDFQVPVSKFQGPDLALVNAAWAMSRLVPTRAHSRSATMLVCDLRGEAFYATSTVDTRFTRSAQRSPHCLEQVFDTESRKAKETNACVFFLSSS